jgi:hypothetical protein
VAVESGTVAFFVTRRRAARGLAPPVIDVREVPLKAHRPTQTSDRRDAFELGTGLRRRIDRAIVHVPRAAVRQLRAAHGELRTSGRDSRSASVLRREARTPSALRR